LVARIVKAIVIGSLIKMLVVSSGSVNKDDSCPLSIIILFCAYDPLHFGKRSNYHYWEFFNKWECHIFVFKLSLLFSLKEERNAHEKERGK